MKSSICISSSVGSVHILFVMFFSDERCYNDDMLSRPCHPISWIRDANLLYTTVTVIPIPPAVVNSSGENEPCSISPIWSSYFLFFSISCLL